MADKNDAREWLEKQGFVIAWDLWLPDLLTAYAASVTQERDALREALILANGAMNYMGDILNGMDAAENLDREITASAFAAVKAILNSRRAAAEESQPK